MAQQKWVIDAAHTSVEFSVRHMMIATAKGRFSGVEGSIVGDPQNLQEATIEATIDAKTIDTRETQRDEHLRSADFFDVDNFPTLEFKSTNIQPNGENQYVVEGELTIKGTTRPVQLETTMEGVINDMYGKQRMGLSATGEINRSDFGLTWNVALEAGGFVVADKVKLELHVEAVLEE